MTTNQPMPPKKSITECGERLVVSRISVRYLDRERCGPAVITTESLREQPMGSRTLRSKAGERLDDGTHQHVRNPGCSDQRPRGDAYVLKS